MPRRGRLPAPRAGSTIRAQLPDQQLADLIELDVIELDVIAATAELAGHVVLHLDNDFELLAEITRQPTEKLSVAP